MNSQAQIQAETNTLAFFPICPSLGGQSYLAPVAGGRYLMEFTPDTTVIRKR